jgi:hypothetical protein
MESFYTWFLSLSENYGVNPFIFGSIYIGAIPFFTLSLAWIVRNHKKRISIVIPVISAVLFFLSSYLYLFIAGENLPAWVYIFLAFMLLYFGWSTFTKIRERVKGEDLQV